MTQGVNYSMLAETKVPKVTLNQTKKQFWGSLFVVAGTTIGAGMLALPMSVASLGILGGSVLLISLWAVMYYSALVALDLNIHIGSGNSIAKIASFYLGKSAGIVGASALVLLLNALLVAYTSGATSLIYTIAETYVGLNLSQPLIIVFFILAMTALVCIDMKILDIGNRIFFVVMMGVFLAMMVVLSPKIQISQSMLVIQEQGLSPWLIAIPLFFTSFGFHGSIPSLINYCESRANLIKSAFFWGSFIPVIVYLLWIVGGLSVVYIYDHAVFSKLVSNEANLGVFILTLSEAIDTPWLQSFSWVFSLLAIVTSFLGVAIGLFDYYREHLSRISESKQRFIACVLALGVPLLITLMAEKTFAHILGFAGIFLSVLAVGLPCVIWLKLKNRSDFITQLSRELVITLFLVGIAVIACEVYNICF